MLYPPDTSLPVMWWFLSVAQNSYLQWWFLSFYYNDYSLCSNPLLAAHTSLEMLINPIFHIILTEPLLCDSWFRRSWRKSKIKGFHSASEGRNPISLIKTKSSEVLKAPFVFRFLSSYKIPSQEESEISSTSISNPSVTKSHHSFYLMDTLSALYVSQY